MGDLCDLHQSVVLDFSDPGNPAPGRSSIVNHQVPAVHARQPYFAQSLQENSEKTGKDGAGRVPLLCGDLLLILLQANRDTVLPGDQEIG